MLLAYLFLLALPLSTPTQENQEVSPKPNTYACAKCNLTLFASDTKFDESKDTLSFTRPIYPVNVTYQRLDSFTMLIELTCSGCASHLGIIYDDGPAPYFKRFKIDTHTIVKKDR